MITDIKVNKVLVADGNYAANDVLSESKTAGTAFIFKRCGGSGYIVKATARLKTTAIAARLTMYLFDTLPTSQLNDNEANTAVLNADKDNCIGKIDFPVLEDLGGVSESVATPSTYGNLPLSFRTKDTAETLWGILVTRDAITGETAGDDISVTLSMEP